MTDTSRRGFLRTVGTAALVGSAGCGAIVGGDDGATTIPAGELRSIVGEGSPSIAETIPVDVEPSFLRESAEAVRSILRTVPTPFTAAEIPNGVVRREVSSMVDRARSYLHGAEEAPSPYVAMRRLRWARGSARSAAAAWGAIDAGLTRGQVANRGPPVLDELEAFDERWTYVGEEPVRAALVHSVLERWVLGARNRATIGRDRSQHEPETPLTIGELADDIGQARAALDQCEYVFERFAGSLAEDRDLLQSLQLAGGMLADAVRDHRRELPDVADPAELVDRDVSAVALDALDLIYAEAQQLEDAEHARAEGRPARAVVLAQPVLARFRALESLRSRIADGESFAIEGAADVRAVRADALEAIRSARSATTVPILTDWALADLTGQLQRADDDLADSEGSVQVDFLEFTVSQYVYVDAIARGLPEASAQVASALRRE